ncbi:MAG: VWA domain-containing protein [Jatrophihabitans sp.]
MSFRYGPWHGGPDPLEPPFDVRAAADELAERVLAGESPREAMNRLLSQGDKDRRGLDSLRRAVREEAKRKRRDTSLTGTLDKVRELLDEAVELERQALFPDPDDSARMAEAELDSLPRDTSRAVRELSEYPWRSPEAAERYEQINEMLRTEVLDAQFAGMRDSLQNASPEDMARMAEMMRSLNDMLDADARGEHTPEQFEQFMQQYGEFFPDNPSNLDELIDSLARRAAAAERLMNSLTAQQRGELSNLMSQSLSQAGLADELGRLQRGLRAARPDLRWDSSEGVQGNQPGQGFADATAALADLADLDELAAQLGQDYPGASLGDIDEELVERALGRRAVEDVDALRRLEKELQQQGYVDRSGGGLTLTPRAMRRMGAVALRRVFADLQARRTGAHDARDAGPAGDLTGSTRPWRYGDEQPLDVSATVRNAVLREVSEGRRSGGRVSLTADDFTVAETERRSSAAVALLVDMSFSMHLRGTWGEAKTTALALHSLISTKYPQDHIEIIGFSDYARTMSPAALVGHEWERVQGTNLQHGLMMARRYLDRYPGSEPVILVITDGEPTAHLTPDGYAVFAWPPTAETIAATLAEVQRCTRRGATINVFMLDDDPELVDFMSEVGRRNGGRVLLPKPGALGEYVVSDYLRTRGGGRRAG